MSHFIAAKIEYKHPSIDFYLRFVHAQQPAAKPVKGKTFNPVVYDDVK